MISILKNIIFSVVFLFGGFFSNSYAACPTLTMSNTDVSCFGASDGTASVSASGGSGNYNYTWSNGGNTSTIFGLVSGIYSVDVLDNVSGCVSFSLVIVNQPDQLTSSYSQVDVSCFGESTGSADLTVSGGNTTYTYAWSSGSSSEDVSGLLAGTYTVTITDANSCTANNSVTIDQPASSVSSSIVGTNVSCQFGIDGSVDLTTWGGTTPYNFNWNSGTAFSEDLTGLAAGTFSVVITDDNGCTSTNTVVLTEPSALTSSIAGTDILCKGDQTGSIDLTVSGGNLPYSYSWTNSSFSLSWNIEDLTSLQSESYFVTVTDNRGCQTTSSVVIGEPAASLSSVLTASHVTCFGNTDGSIDLTASGGSGGNSFLWSNGSTNEDLSSLAEGLYNVTITDVNGCSFEDSIVVQEPISPLAGTIVETHVNCFLGSDGSVDLTPTGGTSPYTFDWNGGTYTSEDLSGVPAGVYNVTITDVNSCLYNDGVVITEPTQLVATDTLTNVLCHGQANGSIDLTVSGGVVPYTFTWASTTYMLAAVTEDLSNLLADTYIYTVQDNNGCNLSDSVLIIEPQELTTTISGVNINCAGESTGSVDLVVSGGTGNYTYAWENDNGPIGTTSQDLSNVIAGVYSVTTTDQNGCSVSNQIILTEPGAPLTSTVVSTDVQCHGGADGAIDLEILGGTIPYVISWSNGSSSEDISGLAQGTYTNIIIDDNGCINTNIVVIDQPSDSLSVTASITDIACYGETNGALDLSVSGGTTPYSYTWANSSFSLSIISQDIDSLQADNYSVMITDNNGCILQDTFAVNQPPLLTGTLSAMDVNCHGGNDGSCDLNVSGGVTSYVYNWSTGATTEDISTLIAGNYYVTVTDFNNCVLMDSIVVNQPIAPLALSLTTEDVTCNAGSDGSIDLEVTGGTLNYLYNWSSGDSLQDLENLTAGMYFITVTDANGCVSLDSIEVIQPDFIDIQSQITQVRCFGESNGAIDITVTGGTSPYGYHWTDSDFVLSATSEDLTNLASDIYTVTVTDTNGCTNAKAFLVDQPQLLTASVTPTNVACFGDMDGLVDLQVQGGTPAYTFLWSTGHTTEDVVGLGNGTYTVTVSDSNGCIVISSVTVSQPPEIFISFDVTEVSCADQIDGEMMAIASGGMGGYTYAWSNGGIDNPITQLLGGNYSVTVTDIAGCYKDASEYLPTNPKECISIPNAFTPNGDGKNDTWIIKNIELYEYNFLQVFTRWGRLVFSSNGLDPPWDGNFKGREVPSTTYYYILDLKNEATPKTGPITIVR